MNIISIIGITRLINVLCFGIPAGIAAWSILDVLRANGLVKISEKDMYRVQLLEKGTGFELAIKDHGLRATVVAIILILVLIGCAYYGPSILKITAAVMLAGILVYHMNFIGNCVEFLEEEEEEEKAKANA